MKLNDLYKMNLQEVLAKMNIIDVKFHTDDNGNIITIEVKYGTEEERRERNPFG